MWAAVTWQGFTFKLLLACVGGIYSSKVTQNTFHVICRHPIERPAGAVTKISCGAISSYVVFFFFFLFFSCGIPDPYIAIYLGTYNAFIHTYFPIPVSGPTLVVFQQGGADVSWPSKGSSGCVLGCPSVCIWDGFILKLPYCQSSGGRFPCCRGGTEAQ